MIAAAIPVKLLSEAKSRLASRLRSDQRAALVEALMEQTVAALRQSGAVDCIALVTDEQTMAEGQVVTWLPDAGSLNCSLERAAKWAIDEKADALLVVPGDLPLLTPEVIRRFIGIGDVQKGVALAPTHDGGTGGLLLRPPDAISPAFGPGSFQRHVLQAEQQSLRLEIFRHDAFLYDLDTADDFDRLLPNLPVWSK